ncbi:dehydrogenase/reductase SDR family member on chromosome X-like [Oncorhynchus keta]|uniref:dehydrogenase/reductase SDR family member on chromosome X-like n=1 Tax=Oncorhynchus keta TaxID=8018 RepID=UPI00227A329F|nr:dehydrogenase/reductase SDR family member on chromosome X-like [Oncorhynchus keta]
MASLGAHFIIAGQQEREGVSAVKRIREENREAKGHSPHNPVWFCVALDITDWLESEHTFSKRLNRRGFPVSSCAVDPGMVDRSLYRHLFPPGRLAQTAITRLLFRSPSQGVSMVLNTALSPSLEGERGGYWSNGRTEMSTLNTYNPRLQLGLWDFSCRLVSLQEQHQP